jgi:hypothetical protein
LLVLSGTLQEEKYSKALDMLRRVEQLLIDDVDIDRTVAKELRALLDDAFGFYYYRRGKYVTGARQHSNKFSWHISLSALSRAMPI